MRASYLVILLIFVSASQAQIPIGVTTTTAFDSAQRSVCRDGNGYIHAVWLYNISRIAYANSSNNGTTWNYNYYFQGNVSNSSSWKTYPSIDCDGNNISVSYEDSTFDDLIVGLSTDNGGSWSWQGVRTSCLATYTTIARRGARVYVAFITPTSSVCGYADGNISYSTNGGSTWTHVRAFDGWYILHMGNQYYDRIVLAVDGAGTASDRVHAVARYYGLDDMGYSMSGMNYRNSSNGGASYIPIGVELPYAYSPTVSQNGTNIYYIGGNSAATYFNSSSNYGETWTGFNISDVNNPPNITSYASVSTNYLGYPMGFWSGNRSGSTFDVEYRNYSGASWDPKIWITQDAVSDNYVTASQYFNPASNCSDAIWVNGTYPNYNISLASICYSPAGPPPAGGNATIPVMDIGDPLYCSIPSITGAANTEILCMPKDNSTGQPLTGLTINCQANAQGLYTAGVQAASACGERAGGMYNWTFLGSSMTAGSTYTINCTTAINTVYNGFGASIYIMPSFALSTTVTALSTNITSVNDTVIAVGSNLTNHNTTMVAEFGAIASNLTTLQFEILQVGSNITSVNTTMNAKFLEVIEDLFYIQGNVTAMNNSLQNLMTASWSNFANTTAINNTLGTFITASYSNWLNLTSHNTTMTTQYGKISENLTLILGNLSALDIGKLAQNLTNINMTLVATNNSLQVLMTASSSNFLNNTAMNNSLASFYGKLSENMTLILGNMSALDMGALSTNITSVNNTVKAVGSNLTQINVTIVATNNSLSTLMTASYSNFANVTALNYSLTSYFNAIGTNLTNMNISVMATNNSLASFYGNLASNLTNHNTTMVAEYGAIANNLTTIQLGITATNNSMTAYYNALASNLTQHNATMATQYGLLASNLSTIQTNIATVNTNVIAVGSNLTNHNTTMVAEFGAIASNLTNIQNGITATNNSLTAYYNAIANNLTSVNNTVIEVGYNVTLLNLNVGAIAANLTNINSTLVATNNSLQVLMTASASNFLNTTAMNNSMTAYYNSLANNITSVNSTVIAVGSNLTNYYWSLAANLTEFNTTSMALLAQIGINITSVNNTVIIVGMNQSMNATRVFNILSAIAGCIPCPIGGLVGGGGSTTIPIPALFSGGNYTVETQPAPSQLIKVLGAVLVPLFVISFFTYRHMKKQTENRKKKKKEEKKPPPNPAKD